MSPNLKPNPNPNNPAPPESLSEPTPPPVELEVFKAMPEAKIFPLPLLKFLTFDGKSDLSQWILKAEQYFFPLLHVPEKQKVPIAREVLPRRAGDALQYWLMWMEDRTKACSLDWAKFVRGIKDRCGTDYFFRPTEIKQTGDLEAEFLRLKAKVFGADQRGTEIFMFTSSLGRVTHGRYFRHCYATIRGRGRGGRGHSGGDGRGRGRFVRGGNGGDSADPVGRGRYGRFIHPPFAPAGGGTPPQGTWIRVFTHWTVPRCPVCQLEGTDELACVICFMSDQYGMTRTAEHFDYFRLLPECPWHGGPCQDMVCFRAAIRHDRSEPAAILVVY